MKRPYIITAHNSETEYNKLKAEADLNDPLEFLGDIKLHTGEWADEIVCFDISAQSEFAIIDDSVIGKINTALIDFGFNVNISDVSQDLLYNKIDLTNAPVEVLSKITKYYVETYEIDDVLEKIFAFGKDFLSKSDYVILNKKS